MTMQKTPLNAKKLRKTVNGWEGLKINWANKKAKKTEFDCRNLSSVEGLFTQSKQSYFVRVRLFMSIWVSSNLAR